MAIQQSVVTLLREARGWTQTRLAKEAGLSQAVVSKFETGALELEPDRVARLAQALDALPELVEQSAQLPPIQITCLHRRRASTMTVGTMKRIEAVTHLSRISVEGLLAGIELAPTRKIERMPLTTGETPSNIARELRRRWTVPPQG